MEQEKIITKLNIDNEFIKTLNEKIPEKLIRVRDGQGNSKLSYISGYTVVKILNRLTNCMWDWEVKKCWIEEGQMVKDYKTGQPRKDNDMCHCLGVLTVHLFDEKTNEHFTIKKEGYGSQICLPKTQQRQNAYKGASTDALKKAASYLGVGAELYLEDEELDLLNPVDVGIWTDEMKAKYVKEWSYIESMMKKFNATLENFDELVQQRTNYACTRLYDLTEEQLVKFVQDFKKTSGEA